MSEQYHVHHFILLLAFRQRALKHGTLETLHIRAPCDNFQTHGKSIKASVESLICCFPEF